LIFLLKKVEARIEVKNYLANPILSKCYRWGVGLVFLSWLSACNSPQVTINSNYLNSRFNDEQPAISGDGRKLVFVSSRNGSSQIYLYNLDKKQLSQLPGLNFNGAIAQTPSLSRTGRYIIYVSSIEGRPDLVLYDRAINRPEILTKGYRSWIRNPHISPEGRYIVFETARRGQWDVEVFDRGPNIEPDLADGIRINP
jgi:Tol biopolymer transport system component